MPDGTVKWFGKHGGILSQRGHGFRGLILNISSLGGFKYPRLDPGVAIQRTTKASGQSKPKWVQPPKRSYPEFNSGSIIIVWCPNHRSILSWSHIGALDARNILRNEQGSQQVISSPQKLEDRHIFEKQSGKRPNNAIKPVA